MNSDCDVVQGTVDGVDCIFRLRNSTISYWLNSILHHVLE